MEMKITDKHYKLAPSPQSSPSRGEEIGGGNFEIPYNKL